MGIKPISTCCTFDNELREIVIEIVRNETINDVMIGLDFFDASINRIAAWTMGKRNMVKALLYAMLMPYQQLNELKENGDYTKRLALMEEFKTYPFGAIWNYYCKKWMYQ